LAHQLELTKEDKMLFCRIIRGRSLSVLTIPTQILILTGLLWPVGDVRVRATVNTLTLFNTRPALGNTIAQSQVVLANIGTAANRTSSATTTITTTGAVAAGNSIIVAFAMDPATGTVSCSDSASNTYNNDVDVTNGAATLGVRTVIFSTHNVAALSSGGTITISHPTVTAKAASAIMVTGLAMTSTLDRTASATGLSTTPASGSTATTTQAQELLLSAIGTENRTNETFTLGTGYRNTSPSSRAGTNTGAQDTNITINPEYSFRNTTGMFAADGTLQNTRRWAAAIATYKVALPTAVLLASFTAQADKGQVQILWDTVSEIDVAGFNILRSDGENQPYVQLNSSLIPALAFGSPIGARYSFTDATVTRLGWYLYVLEVVLLDGSRVVFGPISVVMKRLRGHIVE
jgi:hypothetical protein